MTADELIHEYVDAARAVELWTTRAEQYKCESAHLHATSTRLLPAGSTCAVCRARINAIHQLRDARERRNAALAEQHRHARNNEIEQHSITRERRRVTRGALK